MKVDAQHHFWDPTRATYPWMVGEAVDAVRRAFTPDDLAPELAAQDISGTVLVQTISSEDETREFLELAARTDFVWGVVGWVDLTSPRVGDDLDALIAGPGGDRLVGIRHQVHDEADPEWLNRPDVRRGLAAGHERGLGYDLLVPAREVPSAWDRGRALPRLQVGFVTGAGSGIGRATAGRLARDGYTVGVFDLDPNGVEGTVDAIVSLGGQAVGFTGDVRDEAAVTSALEALAREAPLWLVANVAGIGVAATVVETTNEEWQRVISVNLTGTFIVCRAAVPIMLRSGGGVIVNVASAGGLVGIAECAAYCASKAGVIGLTRAIAVDHAAAGLRAVAICPGTR